MPHIQNLSNIHLQHPSVLTIGVFDGVHKGHQYLIRKLVNAAHNTDRLAAVLTFFPHPDLVVQGIRGRYYLTTDEQRATYLLQLGVDYVITHPFNEAIRQMRASEFVDRLVEHLQLRELWVGANFTLGYQRGGDVSLLTRQGVKRGFSVQVVDLLQSEGEYGAITSTLIRDALNRGDVEQVRGWLGRPYAISGKVIRGSQRGRGIGFPTANIAAWDQQVVPAYGVYVGRASMGNERHMAVTNVGTRPTFDNGGVTVEAHLLDFDRDIYGQELAVTFEKYLRPEMKFSSLEGLIRQIHADVEQGREYLDCCVEI